MTRRRFLHLAGGLTFLGLVPIGDGLFQAQAAEASLPLFTAVPYLQPGPAATLTAGADTLVVAWQTEDVPAGFEVSYGPTQACGRTAMVTASTRVNGGVGKDASHDDQLALGPGNVWQRRRSYSALLTGLTPGQTCYYRVRGNGTIIAEGHAAGRKPRGSKIRFATFGDNSTGDISDRAIAYYAYQSQPDFVMNVGDNVYDRGLDSEYARYFFASYNADVPDLHAGAPLLRSVRYYTILGNHDVHNSDGAHFDNARDSLGYYTAMHLPLNGVETVAHPTPTLGDVPDVIAQFHEAAGPRYPRQANYSYDYGDAHFLCLDSNLYIDPTDPALTAWITQDLAGTDARWKFVALHHAPFNVGTDALSGTAHAGADTAVREVRRRHRAVRS